MLLLIIWKHNNRVGWDNDPFNIYTHRHTHTHTFFISFFSLSLSRIRHYVFLSFCMMELVHMQHACTTEYYFSLSVSFSLPRSHAHLCIVCKHTHIHTHTYIYESTRSLMVIIIWNGCNNPQTLDRAVCISYRTKSLGKVCI